MLSDSVHGGLWVSAWRQGYYAGVANAEISSPIHTQMWIYNASHFSRKHRTSPSRVVCSDGPFLDKSRSTSLVFIFPSYTDRKTTVGE